MNSIPQSFPLRAWASCRPPRRMAAAGMLLLVLIVAGIVRLSGLGQESLWYDEVHSMRRAREGGFSAIAAALGEDVHPPVYFWVLHVWLRCVGTSDSGARLLSALFGIGAVWALYYWGRGLRLPRRACLAGAALFAVNPHAVWYSQEVRMYALEVFLGTLHLGLAARVFRDAVSGKCPAGWRENGGGRSPRFRFCIPTATRHGLWLLSGTALLWTHFYGVFFLAAEAVWGLLILGRLHRIRERAERAIRCARQSPVTVARIALQRVPRPLFFCVGLGGALFWWGATWWPLLGRMISRLRSGEGISWLGVLYRVHWRTPWDVLTALVAGPQIPGGPAWLGTLAVLGMLLLIAAGIARVQWHGRSPIQLEKSGSRWIPVLVAFLLIALPVGVSLWKVIILGGQRYLTIAAGPLCLAAGLGIERLSRSRPGWNRIVLVVAVVPLVIACIGYFSTYYGGREKRMWRESMAFVTEKAHPDDALTAVPDYSLWCIEHYNPRGLRVVPPEPPEGDAAPRRLWILTPAAAPTPIETQLLSAGWTRREGHHVAGRWVTTYIRIALYIRP